ncbi:EAL domain-containing protein, partial [Vibrio sp. 2089]|uniref:EAL domain-containing protein n=1 Tax=Vibrio sp. 2089 TaxID=3074591 RepID=UPI00296525C2
CDFIGKLNTKRHSQGLPPLTVHVNLSAQHFYHSRLISFLQSMIEEHNISAGHLVLEITESMLMGGETESIHCINEIKQLGVQLALDDFGTGYASFSYLKKYPFDAIKIDKSFVQQMEKSDDDRAIICSIIHIAKKLELQVVIEGIESPQQEQFLIGEGCDIGQGFLYGKPMPCNEFEQSLFNQRQIGGQYAYSS